MPISTRVTIPSHFSEAKSLRDMCAAADQLKQYDTPQALPVLGLLDTRAPSRASMLINFPLGTLLSLIFFAAILTVVAAVGWVEFLVYRRLIHPIYLEEHRWLIIWGLIALLTFLWLVVFSKKAHAILAIDRGPADVQLSSFWRGLLWLAHQVTRIAMLAAWLMGIAGLLLPVFFGLHHAWNLVQGFEPARLGPFLPLQQYLGLSPYVRIGQPAVLAAAGILATILAIWARPLLLGAFWALGLFMVYQTANLDLMELGIVAGLAVLWLLQVPHLAARMLGGLCRRWHGQIELLVLGWELRDSLAAAFSTHRDRNRDRVTQDGASAVCKDDLAFFTQRRAGPVSYWCCPECLDDDSAYTGIKTVRGVLDTELASDYAQEGNALLVNLRAWQDSRGVLAAPPLQEVKIGKLADPHEVEMFITQYQNVQAERKWSSLGKVTAVIAPDSNLDENGRRQVQRNFRTI